MIKIELQAKQERYNILCSRILTNKTIVGKGLWEIGLDIKEIKERELYLLEFTTFEEFLEKKVNLSRSTAYLAISITTEYELRDFVKWGFKKLDIIKRHLPDEEDRDKFLKAENVQPVGQLEESLSKYKLEHNIQEISRLNNRLSNQSDINEKDYELKLIRQANEILKFKEILENCRKNWLKASNKCKHEEVMKFRKIFENEGK